MGPAHRARVLETQGLLSTVAWYFTPSEMLVFGQISPLALEVSNNADYWLSPCIFDSAWAWNDSMALKRVQVRSETKTRGSWPSVSERMEERPPNTEFLVTCPHELETKGVGKRQVHLLMDRIKELSMAELRKALIRVDVSHCVEKLDYQKALQAFLLFGNRPVTCQDMMLTRKGISYPDWALNINEGKATYFHALREAKRTNLYRSELAKCEWAFWFKLAQDDQGRLHDMETLNRNNGFEIQKHKVRFFEDGRMSSEFHSHDLHYSVEVDNSSANPYPHQILTVQVENYPSLQCYRQTNGAWTLENQNVVIEGSPMEELPLL